MGMLGGSMVELGEVLGGGGFGLVFRGGRGFACMALHAGTRIQPCI